MQVLLKHTEQKPDIICSVCGQGFRTYWARTSPAERATMQAIVEGELIRQHDGKDKTPAAHPSSAFNVPEWSGDYKFSGAALLGGHSGLHRVMPAGTSK